MVEITRTTCSVGVGTHRVKMTCVFLPFSRIFLCLPFPVYRHKQLWSTWASSCVYVFVCVVIRSRMRFRKAIKKNGGWKPTIKLKTQYNGRKKKVERCVLAPSLAAKGVCHFPNNNKKTQAGHTKESGRWRRRKSRRIAAVYSIPLRNSRVNKRELSNIGSINSWTEETGSQQQSSFMLITSD